MLFSNVKLICPSAFFLVVRHQFVQLRIVLAGKSKRTIVPAYEFHRLSHFNRREIHVCGTQKQFAHQAPGHRVAMSTGRLRSMAKLSKAWPTVCPRFSALRSPFRAGRPRQCRCFVSMLCCTSCCSSCQSGAVTSKRK